MSVEKTHVQTSIYRIPLTSGRRGDGSSWRSRRRARNESALRSPVLLTAVGLLALLALLGALSNLLPLADPTTQSLTERLRGPSGTHWLGTDNLGRDVLSRLIHGTSVTLFAATLGTAVALVGAPMGMLVGYIGGLADTVVSRFFDALSSIPPILLAVGVVGFLGPGLTNAMIAVGLVLAPRFFRLAQASARSIRHETYIEASRAVGCSEWRILRRHVLPNAAGPLIVQTASAVGIVIGVESGLSFLGLGVQPPQASWGSMLRDAFQTSGDHPLLLLPPSICIVLTILLSFVIADALAAKLTRADVT